MINYVYKKLQTFKMKPYIKSKINLWSILNNKHTFVNTSKIFFFFKKINSVSYATIGTLGNFIYKNTFIFLEILLLVIIIVIIFLL